MPPSARGGPRGRAELVLSPILLGDGLEPKDQDATPAPPRGSSLGVPFSPWVSIGSVGGRFGLLRFPPWGVRMGLRLLLLHNSASGPELGFWSVWPGCCRDCTEMGPPAGRRPAGGPILLFSIFKSGRIPARKPIFRPGGAFAYPGRCLYVAWSSSSLVEVTGNPCGALAVYKARRLPVRVGTGPSARVSVPCRLSCRSHQQSLWGPCWPGVT